MVSACALLLVAGALRCGSLPAGALANTNSDGRFDAAQRLLDWLPSRVLLLTFACSVTSSGQRPLTREAFDTEVTAETLLAQGVTRAWRLDDEALDDPQGVVTAVETAQKAMNRATGSGWSSPHCSLL